MGALPILRCENTHQGLWGNGHAELSAILLNVSERNRGQYRKTKIYPVSC